MAAVPVWVGSVETALDEDGRNKEEMPLLGRAED
jgi:hypothetical protein